MGLRGEDGDVTRGAGWWWRVGRRVVYVVVAVWVGWFVVARWTAVPAAYEDGAAGWARPAVVVEVVEAAASLPEVALPPEMAEANPTPRGGWGVWAADHANLRWLVDLSLRGVWDPTQHEAIAVMEEYLRRESVDAALGSLVANASQLPRWSRALLDPEIFGDEEDPAAGGGFMFHAFDSTRSDALLHAQLVLLARARGQAARGAHEGVVTDLTAALRLWWFETAQYWLLVEDPWGWGRYGGRPPIEPLFDREVKALLADPALPDTAAARLKAVLTDELPTRPSDALLARLGWPADHAAWLDQYYTRDGDGGGWLVVSYAADELASGFVAVPASGLWNVASPAYYGRGTVAAAMDRVVARLRAYDDEPLLRVVEETERVLIDSISNPMLAGPYAQLVDRGAYAGLDAPRARLVANAQVWRVMAGLAIYRATHGHYPETLAALAPDYLREVPVDLWTQQLFVYTRDGAGYTLKAEPMRGHQQTYWPSPRPAALEGRDQRGLR